MKPKDSNNDKPNFQLPDGYFDSFNKELEAQIALEEVLGGKIASGFNTPECYFDDFKVEMIPLLRKRISAEQFNKPKVIALHKRQWLWTAASVAAIVLVAISIFPMSSNALTFDSLEVAEIEAYVENQDIAFSDYEIGIMLTDDAFETLESTSYIDDAALIEYLENNTEDESILIE